MMNLMDLERQYQYREENMQVMNRNKMNDMLKYFFYLCKKNHTSYFQGNGLWNTFVVNYDSLVRKGLQNDIDFYMKANGFQEDAFIYELLHDRNSNQNIHDLIVKKDNYSSITLYNKEIQFMDADQYFENTGLRDFFITQKLKEECFDRSLDLLSYIPGSKAVISYLPNIFVGGYYHAYISCVNGILVDPASNLVLLNQEAKNLLKGQVVFSISKEELHDQLELLNTVNGMSEYDRPQLLKLALFYECSLIEEEEKTDNLRK